MTHQAKAISYDFRIRAFWMLTSICIVSFAVYIYAVHTTIRNTALRQNLEEEVSQLAVDSSALEFAYIQKSQNVSLDTAKTYGFKEARRPLYVSRTSSSGLSLNTAR